ncbi:MAG: alpha/beta hydrolase [Anaeromyxobacter sp. RBG_16_69_14]|nr:MAG: alpha/beta hydrolase [Anaeromyxobacter sp. RBG_16_69_14]
MPEAIRLLLASAALAAAAVGARAAPPPGKPPEPLGIAMEGYPYPFPVSYLPLELEGQDMSMAFMNVAPTAMPNGRAALLLHGKNFFGAYWEGTIRALAGAGYRVVVPDQIGFGKSSKPDLHYTFEQLAASTRQLLEKLGIEKVVVVGHSMGGMLAVRFALMYPQLASALVLENPIGLENYREKVPYQSVEAQYFTNLHQTEEGLRKFVGSYFVAWRSEYEPYVMVPYRWTLSPEYPRYALASALTYQMIYSQPVVQDLPKLRLPTLLVIGQADRTTLGRGSLPKEALERLGRYPELGRKAAAAIPGARLVEIAEVGHVPHLESPARFHDALLEFLR